MLSMQDTSTNDGGISLSQVTSKIDVVIEKITKSKKYSSVRILEEVKADLSNLSGIDASSVATTPVAPVSSVIPDIARPAGLQPYVAQNGEVDDCLTALACGKHVLFTGPTGCGKTHLAHWLSHLRGQEIVTIQGLSGITSEQIIGYPTIENGNRSFVEGLLPIAMQKGNILYLDEPNSIPDGVLFAFHSAMDDRADLVLQDDAGRVVKAHSAFRVIAALNEGYAGTHALNQAFRRRSVVKRLAYLPA